MCHVPCTWTPLSCCCVLQDNVIYERLAPEQSYKDVTIQHLEDFATTGLRTLCLASADINQDFYSEWEQGYYKASTSIQNREKRLEEVAEVIEQVRLPGGTGHLLVVTEVLGGTTAVNHCTVLLLCMTVGATWWQHFHRDPK